MNQEKESTQQVKNLNRVIKIDEARIHSHLDEMVKDTVEETINKLLDAEADRLCNAQRYEHTEGRTDTRAGSYRRKHWRRIRTNNMLERLMREIRRRTNVVGCFPDGNSALMLAAARLRQIAGTKWSTYRYLSMKRLKDQQTQQQQQVLEVAG